VDYVPSRDVLITVGDIIAKAPLNGSLDVLESLSRYNATGVRGNHDQKVIEWRGWLNWITSLSGGQRWLRHLEREMVSRQRAGLSCRFETLAGEGTESRQREAVVATRSKGLGTTRRPLPDRKGECPRRSTVISYSYPFDYTSRMSMPSSFTQGYYQQIRDILWMMRSDSLWPVFRKRKDMSTTWRELRRLQELSLISEIPQNADPWVVLNMRSVLGGKVLKGKKGRYWTEIWQEQMDNVRDSIRTLSLNPV
jgi:hypothetical protein